MKRYAGLLANRNVGIERWNPLTSAPTPTRSGAANGRAHRRRWSSNGSSRDTFQVENWKELKRRNVIDGRLIHLLITSRTRLLFSFGITRSSSDWRRTKNCWTFSSEKCFAFIFRSRNYVNAYLNWNELTESVGLFVSEDLGAVIGEWPGASVERC